MFTFKKIITSFVIIFIIATCVPIDRVGREIRFTTSFQRDGTSTKTAYSDSVFNNKERIDWIEGDNIKIYMLYDNQITNSDYGVVNITSKSERSVGNVVKIGDPLKWQDETGIHTFYSVYPNIDVFNNSTFTFTLPESQTGDMYYAYMIGKGVKDGYTVNDGKVTLEFFPVINTIHLKLSCESAIHLKELKLESVPESNKSITGKYSVTTDLKSQVLNGSNSITCEYDQEFTNIDIPLFLLPGEYKASDLKLTITTDKNSFSRLLSDSSLGDFDMDFYSKQDIYINLEKSGSFEISDAAAQMILAYLRAFDGGEKFYSIFKKFIDKYYSTNEDYLNNFWNPLTRLDVLTVAGAKDRLETFFGDKLTDFLDALSNLEEITMKTYGVKADSLDSSCFKIFKKCKKLSLFCDSTISISIDGLEFLEEITITGQNGQKTLNINNCSNLKVVNINEWNQNDVHKVTIKNSGNPTINKNNNNNKQIIIIE